jgi:hypothetical protein
MPPYLTTRLEFALLAGSPKIFIDIACIFDVTSLSYESGIINNLWSRDENYEQIQPTNGIDQCHDER